ncbi:MAG: tRNA pseudouridine(38-40) synthase TruA [Acidimicrobiales bacterium]
MTLFDPAVVPPDGGGVTGPGDGSPGGDLSADAGREHDPAAPGGPLVRVRMRVAYDGTGFRGFAAQPGQRTVAGALAGALEAAVGRPVKLVCAGRTDAGVHALDQVVHLDLPGALADPDRLARAANRQLAPAVTVRAACVADAGFDARRSATSRRYRYEIDNAPACDPLRARFSWWVRHPLDLAAMRLGTDPLLGEHDFAAFCRRPPGLAAPLVRRVLDACWRREGDERLVFEIEANAFCHQMVRSVVGMLVRVGRGRLPAGEVGGVIASGERSLAGSPAPARGLCLVAVRYGERRPGQPRA